MSPPRNAVPAPATELLGSSPAMAALRAFATRAAEVDVPVLLTGETGTGKTLVARWIHERSARRHGPFVAVNCAAIPEALFESELFGHRRGAFTGADGDHPGLFALACGGILLLDEVAEIDPSRQAKLLTALEDGEVRPVGGRKPEPVDVRVVAATSRDLPRAVADGAFRRDLYHRLALLSCTLPPLRERADDGVLLARRLLRRFGRRHALAEPTLSAEAAGFIRRHPWPGNVRELAHALEAALILDGTGRVERSTLESLVSRLLVPAPDAASAPGPAPEPPPASAWPPAPALPPTSGLPPTSAPATTSAPAPGAARGSTDPAPPPGSPGPGGRYSFDGPAGEEREVIRATLARCRGNRTQAARFLGMSRTTLLERLRRFGLG